MVEVSDFVGVALLVSLIWMIILIIIYQYAKSKGGQEILATPNFVYPSLSDITIHGKYQMPARSAQKIREELRGRLDLTRYGMTATPNNVRIVYIGASLGQEKDYFKRLRTTRDGVPSELVLLISEANASTQLVDAICTPLMVRKMGQQIQYLFARQSVEDAQLQCKLFMASIMNTLGAKTLVPPFAESSVSELRKLEFLYNTLTENQINEKTHEMIRGAKQRIYVTGWIDREILGDLENAKSANVEVRIITKNPAGSDKSVQQDFKRLTTKTSPEDIKLNPRFHDRFLICDEDCLIGSPYFTIASRTRFESAIFTDYPNIVEGLVAHFDRIWNEEESINPRIAGEKKRRST